jgi:xanthine/uracil permease
MTIVANRATSAPVAAGTASTVRRRQLMGPLVMGPLGLSIGITLILVFTSSATETRLGAPLYWSWLLTGLQVLALWAAGAEHRWGWLLGASVQPPWIVYAVLTDQVGFIPGCAISAAVQICSFVRGRHPREVGGRYPWSSETTTGDEAGGDQTGTELTRRSASVMG